MAELDTSELDELLENARRIAAEAAAVILPIFHGEFSVSAKADASPVTEADLAAHDLICKRLAEATHWPVLSEEHTDIDTRERLGWQRYWLVDPLDGTRLFIRGNDEFSVNIALVENHRPTLGVIHMPCTDVSYRARREGPAIKRLADGGEQPLRTRRPASPPITFSVSATRTGAALAAMLAHVEHRLIVAGSSYKSCLVAEGTADIYPCLGPTSEWDTAAAQIIVEQAGGALTDIEGRALTYNQRESLVNPPFVACGDAALPWREWLDQP